MYPGIHWTPDVFGYWGDHQVVYLLRLLQALRETWPGTLETLLDRAIFSYAHVPYRIAPLERLVADPRATIRFDHDLAAQVATRVAERGGDGRLVPGPDGGVLHVTLLEKLLVSVLARLSNLVPGAGIWMNTQRPEWNDANNALVGHGVSVVTLAHLRRMLEFLHALLGPRRSAAVPVSPEVAHWARDVRAVLEERPSGTPPGPEGDRERYETLAQLRSLPCPRAKSRNARVTCTQTMCRPRSSLDWRAAQSISMAPSTCRRPGWFQFRWPTRSAGEMSLRGIETRRSSFPQTQ